MGSRDTHPANLRLANDRQTMVGQPHVPNIYFLFLEKCSYTASFIGPTKLLDSLTFGSSETCSSTASLIGPKITGQPHFWKLRIWQFLSLPLLDPYVEPRSKAKILQKSHNLYRWVIASLKAKTYPTDKKVQLLHSHIVEAESAAGNGNGGKPPVSKRTMEIFD